MTDTVNASAKKTKDYVLRAHQNYRNKHDNVSLMLPKGTKELIRDNTGLSVNAYIVELVRKDLKENYDVEIGE